MMQLQGHNGCHKRGQGWAPKGGSLNQKWQYNIKDDFETYWWGHRQCTCGKIYKVHHQFVPWCHWLCLNCIVQTVWSLYYFCDRPALRGPDPTIWLHSWTAILVQEGKKTTNPQVSYGRNSTIFLTSTTTRHPTNIVVPFAPPTAWVWWIGLFWRMLTYGRPKPKVVKILDPQMRPLLSPQLSNATSCIKMW